MKEECLQAYLLESKAERMALEKKLDYRFHTLYWELFCLGELLGEKTIRKNYKNALENCKDNLVHLTELVLVLNLKIWRWYNVDDNLGKLYDELWKDADSYAMATLQGDDLHYYLSVLD